MPSAVHSSQEVQAAERVYCWVQVGDSCEQAGSALPQHCILGGPFEHAVQGEEVVSSRQRLHLRDQRLQRRHGGRLAVQPGQC